MTVLPAPLAACTPRRAIRWGVDYGKETDPTVSQSLDLLVLEPDHERPLEPIRPRDGRTLGYLSLGEMARSRHAFAALESAGVFFGPNPNWPDARLADMRHPAWRKCIVEEMAMQIMAQGYDGLFLDTLDNADAIERADPQAAGMVAAAGSLVHALRGAFPDAYLMANRGYALLDGIAPAINAVLGEAMATRWNAATNAYEQLPERDWQWQADRLRSARYFNSQLELLTLDYWDPADSAGVAALYARERQEGFSPYVATLALDRLFPEPKI